MEFSYTIFSFLVFVIFVFRNIFRSSKLSNLPPGPRKLPLIGNLHNLLFSSDPPHRVLRDLSIQYGPLMHMKLGEISTLVVSSAEAAKQVMRTHDIVFASRPTLFATDVITYGWRDIAFAPYGEYWRQVRKICTLELLSAKRVQSLRPIRQVEFYNLCRSIASEADGATLINLTAKIGVTTYDVITQASVGTKIDEQELFVSVGQKIVELLVGLSPADLYPSIKAFSMIGGAKKKVEWAHQQFDRILENIIQKRKLHSYDNDDDQRPEDLLDVLMKYEDDPELPLTIDNIKAILLNMFVAGIETSVTVVDWAMAEMLKQPRIMKAAQDEVRRVFDSKKGYIDESSLDELSYLKLVIKETFRMHPPLPMLVPRESRENYDLDGYHIPCKTQVLVNVWAIARDPKCWEDPESFNPERFLKTPLDFKGNDFEFLPFGAGRRMCPGMSLGLANVQFPLAMLLYHFDWALPHQMKPEQLDMTEHLAIAVRRKHELCVLPLLKRPVPVHQ